MSTRAAAAAARIPPLLNRRFISSDQWIAALDLKGSSRTVRPRQELISEGRRCTSAFFISAGIAIRYRILRDGQRQILNLLLPGDFAGITNSFFETALYSIRAVTSMTVSPVPLAKLIGLFDANPGIAAKVLRLFARDSAICAEHLIGVGRRPAPERIAHFLLELLMRLHENGLAAARSYRLPLTQEMISDALGLSIPYVNRVLHELRDGGLLRIEKQTVIIDDLEELAQFSDFQPHYLAPLSVPELMGDAETGALEHNPVNSISG